MMKHVLILFLSTIAIKAIHAQSGSAKMVKWTYAAKKIADDTYELRLTANVGGKYHIYAQNVGVEDGPVATSFEFQKNPLVEFSGAVKEEGKLIQEFEPVWDGKVNYFKTQVTFVQKVKLKRKVKTAVSGTVTFMVCDDKECLPPSDLPFKINIDA